MSFKYKLKFYLCIRNFYKECMSIINRILLKYVKEVIIDVKEILNLKSLK